MGSSACDGGRHPIWLDEVANIGLTFFCVLYFQASANQIHSKEIDEVNFKFSFSI